jgi:hypothetical protein
MKVQYFVEVSEHNLASSQTWGFRNPYTLQNQFQTTFAQWAEGGGGRVKSVSRDTCEKQGGKLLKLLPQLRPRIRPQLNKLKKL